MVVRGGGGGTNETLLVKKTVLSGLVLAPRLHMVVERSHKHGYRAQN